MADEPRRSVRATKGQHTKSLDLLDQATPEPKKKSTKKAKKVEKEEEAEVIRCVCGALESPDNDPDPWISCDNCLVWQHNVCVGVSIHEEDIPKNYLCEQCDPEFHRDLLDALANGVHLWEQRRKEYNKSKAEEGKDKKKGKKKGKRASDPKPEESHPTNTNGKAKTPSTPVPEPKHDKKDTVSKASAAKRKTRDDSHDNDAVKEPQSKIRKVSVAHTTPRQESPITSGVSAKIVDLESSRQGVAKLMQKSFQHAMPIAIKQGVYALRDNVTLEAKIERLALEVEDAIYGTHGDKSAYTKQARALSANLKSNQDLCNGLLTRTYSARQLAVMATDDMASKEMKQEVAEIQARVDKQSILITDDAPRVRRTHKGEEVIEGDNVSPANDNTMSTSRRRSILDPNAEMVARSRENSPGDQVELPDDIDNFRSHDNIRGNALPKRPLNVDTKGSGIEMRKPSGQADFDINKVFSNVPSQSPVSAHHVRKPSMSNAPPANGPGVDPEIDRMLEDDGADSPPYSPAEHQSDPDVVWRGNVVMDSIATFPATGKHVAGVDISNSHNWNVILQRELKVAGRIDREKANEYLCSLRYSPPSDVVVVNVIPTGETSGPGFRELYDYFQTKQRFGVLANKGIASVRDTYLVPVPPSKDGPLPDFVVNLEGHRIPEHRPDPMILIALVIRNDSNSDQVRAYDGSSEAQSPSVISHAQRQMSLGGAGPSMSPIAPQGSFAPPPIPQQQYPSDDTRYRFQEEQEHARVQSEGEEKARKILGQYSNAPTVGFLMPQAYQMREVEWIIIRAILEEDEKSRIDLAHLSQVLEVRMSQQGQQQTSR